MFCILLLVLSQQVVLSQHRSAGLTPQERGEIKMPENPGNPLDTLSVQPADSITAVRDSTSSNAIDAPIQYAAKDSMIMILDGKNLLYLFGEGNVQYKNLNLTGEYVEVDANDKTVFATFGLDSIGGEFGYPVFKEGNSEYEMKKARYNFKTKKMYITDVITQQGEGYVTATETKKMPNDDLFMRDGRYTTCDEHDHPHFYIRMTKAKIRPGKNIVTGPAYLVIEDVPLPVAVPFGFFPFNSDYSSGIIMPTYGDEMRRGFSLRDGGYYFAFNDYVDLALTGEIFTKGSWGVNAASDYRKRYKFSGNVNAGYLITINGEKDDNDYSKSKDFKVVWTHSQDAKANPFSTLSASVNFSTSSYNRNELNSLYSDQYTQNTKASTINYSYNLPNSPLSFSLNASVNQISRDTSLSVTLPNLTIRMRDIYPFKRKEQIGAPRWYENIRMSYNGLIMNSITAKEYEFFEKSLIKDWRNGMKHDIPVSASFNLMKYITVSPAVSYNEYWYTSGINQKYDAALKKGIPIDTSYQFKRIYNYSASVSAGTKLYGMYKFWSMFGRWTEKTQIRHVLTPSVSFSGAPDFSKESYGYYKSIPYFDPETGREEVYTYSPYSQQLWGVPGKGKTGSLSFSLDNNLEMKVPVGEADSTKKISLIDNLRFEETYNFLADSLNWSNWRASIRLKLGKSSLSLQSQFDTYLYDERGRNINQTRVGAGKGLGRFMGTSTAYSYTLNNESIKGILNWFTGKKKEEDTSNTTASNETSSEENSDLENPTEEEAGQRKSLRSAKKADGEYDSDGYLLSKIPWNLSLNYSLSYGYDRQRFNKEKREYPYAITQTLGISGNISPTKGWNFTFNTSYDFDNKRFATMQCSLSRQMHCWSMSASIIPIGPYQSYNFSIAVNASMLKDLKYTQSSNYRDAMNWGNY
jgi:hypothetical protein